MYWSSLAAELRAMILDALIQEGNVAHCACVSQEWKTAIGKHNFRSIRLTASDVPVLETLTAQNFGLIQYIWYCVELEEYDCSACDKDETEETTEANWVTLKDSIRSLFCALSARPMKGKLTLDISVHSPSDNQHFFKYICFEHADVHRSKGVAQQTSLQHTPLHDSIHNAALPPDFTVIDRLFPDIDFSDAEDGDAAFWATVPQVHSVTGLLLRRQTRRRWDPQALIQLTARLPNLQEAWYEPWREWSRMFQRSTDNRKCSPNSMTALPLIRLTTATGTERFFKSLISHNMKRLTIFEDLRETYIAANFSGLHPPSDAEPIRTVSIKVTQTLAEASLKLEHLSAAFVTDAARFWEARQPQWIWGQLLTLSLTSRMLVPTASPEKINSMLQAAAEAAMNMPKLVCMELWNGGQDHASVFRYRIALSRVGKPASIVWRSTRDLNVDAKVVSMWSAVAKSRSAGSFEVFKELLGPEYMIQSHGDAVDVLELQNQVACPVSIQQIRKEH
ncbi:uncharacterized protein N0V89_011788 [Didymosphaeria variabile]|uniref:DUF6546 domain-containing protein n=1 Tax=Didymosphaeria variabile TaxID=1932322 RepID=A0A9W8XAV0_9PLEO|nr:uncharacterized protein N0V89_011788 [Didymosphaeria variabile]KAJ4345654.1 hypothetical protein N0V89_011788 [Didymosphaeria variabile]